MGLIKYLKNLDETKKTLTTITFFLMFSNFLAGFGQYIGLKKIKSNHGKYTANYRAVETLTSGGFLTNLVATHIAGGGKLVAACYLYCNSRD